MKIIPTSSLLFLWWHQKPRRGCWRCSQWVEEVSLYWHSAFSFLCIGISALMKSNGGSQGGNFLQIIYEENCRGRQVIAFPQVLQSWSGSPVAFYPLLLWAVSSWMRHLWSTSWSCWLTCWSAWATWTVAHVISGMGAECGTGIDLGEVTKRIKQWKNKNWSLCHHK